RAGAARDAGRRPGVRAPVSREPARGHRHPAGARSACDPARGGHMSATPASRSPAPDVLRLDCAGVPALLRSHAANGVVAVRLYLRGGSSILETRHAGVELFYGRVARRGTQRFAKEELNAALARMGTEFGTVAGEDHTLFQMRCLRRHLAASWEILTDI